MSQVRIDWLADVLRNAGCQVKTYKGWRNRSRPETSGGFAPRGLLIHHTGTRTSLANPAPTVGLCIRGRSDLPGPLAHAVLGFDGVFHVIAAGRANHAGTARADGPMPSGDGNALYVGIEVDYSGSQDMGDKQREALIKGSAAILKKMGRDESFMRGHKETSIAGKWDPGRHGASSPQYLMADFRSDVRRELAPLVQYVLMAGDDELAHSSPVRRDDGSARRDRLKSFLGNRTAMIDAAHEDGKQPRVVRRKV